MRFVHVMAWGRQKKWNNHDDVIQWKHFPRYWPFMWGIHRWPVNSQQKGQWRGTLMFSLICAWINGWVNNREAGDLRRNRAHYDAIVMPNSMAMMYFRIMWVNVSRDIPQALITIFTISVKARLSVYTKKVEFQPLCKAMNNQGN